MKTFDEFVLEKEYLEFCTVDFENINESLLNSMSGALKKKIDFVRSVADKTGNKLSDVVSTFKNRKVFSFFSKIKWSFDKLVHLLKTGYKAYGTLIKVVSEYLANNPVVKWTDEKLVELDNFLKSHPKTRRIAGFAVAGLLAYVWFHVAFSGHVETDFDMSHLIAALAGNFSLSDIFSGANGITMIGLLLAGTLSGGFPWPSRANTQFITAIVGTLIHKYRH